MICTTTPPTRLVRQRMPGDPFRTTCATNLDYVDGKLFTRTRAGAAGQAFRYFQNPVTLEPYSQLVIALFNAVDNTQTYSKSINFANPEYYCTYDIEKFNHKASYPLHPK